MSYLKDREIWLSNVPTGNPPAGYFWKFIQNGKVVVRDSSGNNQMMIATSGSQAITGSLTVTEGITGTVSSASYVEYSGVANKPTLVSGSSQITYSGLTGIPSGIVSGSSQVTFLGLSSIPSGIVSGSGQVDQFGYATTGSNGFNGSQSITGSLTVTGQVIAQTLNVQQVTSSIVYSSGSNIFGNTVGNVQSFTGSLQVSGSSHYLRGNVGIGEISPATPLHISTTGLPAVRLTLGSEARVHNISGVNNGRDLNILPFRHFSVQTGNGIAEGQITLNAYEDIILGTGASYTSRFTILSGGAVAIGVTGITDPYTATGGGWQTVQFGKGGVLGAYRTDNESMTGFNTYTSAPDGVNKAIISNIGGTAIRYYEDRITFNTFSTSGTAQTQTERMRIGSDGHLILKSTTTGGGTQGDFYVIENGGLVIDSSEGATQRYIEFTTGNTTKMLITAGGNVGIGISPDFKLDVNGVTQIRDTLLVTKQIGKSYAQTSSSGTTSFVNTGIFYNTSIIGFSNNGTYFLTVTGNPNGAGSSEYRAVLVGYITVTTGYDFGISSVVQNISYTETLNKQALNISTLSVSVVFWNGSTESTQQVHGTTNNQIRIKITGYNSGNIGAAQDVRITKIAD